jgi:quercetin dioxygenase-like cupin family protein
MGIRTATALLIAIIAASPAASQDLVAVAPLNAKVEYEDSRIRVVRLRIAPGESLPMHDRPARIVIALTSSEVRQTGPDGNTRTMQVTAGKIAWSGPGRRAVTNMASPLANVIVEMKTAAAAAKASLQPPKQPSTVLDEPHQDWLFENQYVRVYDVRIQPGEMTAFHRLAYDSVFVRISGGLIASQVQGQSWSKTEKSEAGTVEFRPDSQRPYTHRVRNDGPAEYHVVIVQLLQ